MLDEREENAPLTYIKGEPFFDIHTFSLLSGRSLGTLKRLFEKGNRIRKMEGVMVGKTIYINAAELHEYPYVTSGSGYYHKVYRVNDALQDEYFGDWDAVNKQIIPH